MKTIARVLLVGIVVLCRGPAMAQTMGFAQAADQLGTLCGADIDKYCKGLNLGNDRIHNRLTRNPKVSARCKTGLATIARMIDARFAAQAASSRLCDADAHRLCGGVAAGDGNVLDCLLASWKVVSQ